MNPPRHATAPDDPMVHPAGAGARSPGAFSGATARAACAWIGLIAMLAALAPFVASGRPLWLDGASPLLRSLRLGDWLLLACAPAAIAMLALRGRDALRSPACLAALLGTTAALILTTGAPPPPVAPIEDPGAGAPRYTLIPWSPTQRPTDRDASFLQPGASADQALARALVSGLPPVGPLDGPETLRRLRERIDPLPLTAEMRRRLHDAAAVLFEPPAEPTRQRLHEALGSVLAGSGPRHALGTDRFGQDVLSVLVHACRLALAVGLVSTGIAVMLGVLIGAVMGYFGGWVDAALMRLIEVFSGLPQLFVLVAAGAVLPRNTLVLMALIGLMNWTSAARYTRAEFMRLRNAEYIDAARALGLPMRSILFRHMLPGAASPVLIDASFTISAAVVLEATLGFLGLGPADQPSWGRLLADAIGPSGGLHWWLAVFPGAALFLTAVSYNIIGEALRDAADPKRHPAHATAA